jgi:hypothetical protein
MPSSASNSRTVPSSPAVAILSVRAQGHGVDGSFARRKSEHSLAALYVEDVDETVETSGTRHLYPSGKDDQSDAGAVSAARLVRKPRSSQRTVLALGCSGPEQ